MEARRARATRIGRRAGLIGVLVLAVILRFSVQLEGDARIYAAVALVATWFLVRRIARSVAMEYLPRSASRAASHGDHT
jgi:predicted LPLAT superfamily acyltransferase